VHNYIICPSQYPPSLELLSFSYLLSPEYCMCSISLKILVRTNWILKIWAKVRNLRFGTVQNSTKKVRFGSKPSNPGSCTSLLATKYFYIFVDSFIICLTATTLTKKSKENENMLFLMEWKIHQFASFPLELPIEIP